MMKSDNPDRTLQDTVVMEHEIEDDCDGSSYDDVAHDLNNQINMDCPESFELFDDKTCIHMAKTSTTYEAAKYYCETKASGLGRLLRLETADAITAFTDFIEGQDDGKLIIACAYALYNITFNIIYIYIYIY